MRRLLASIVALALTSPAWAYLANPHVAGDFQGWDAGASAMTETTPGSGIWTATFGSLAPGSRHEFKITDGTWNNSFPGPNSWLTADGSGNITISYDTNTYSDGWSTTTERLGLSSDPGTWTAAGDFEGWNNAAGNMVPIGGGIYSIDVNQPPGTYSWKAVVTGSWDSISYDGRSTNTANWSYTLNPDEFVRLSVNPMAGTVKQEVLPTPEPASLGLLALGAVALMRRRRA